MIYPLFDLQVDNVFSIHSLTGMLMWLCLFIHVNVSALQGSNNWYSLSLYAVDARLFELTVYMNITGPRDMFKALYALNQCLMN